MFGKELHILKTSHPTFLDNYHHHLCDPYQKNIQDQV